MLVSIHWRIRILIALLLHSRSEVECLIDVFTEKLIRVDEARSFQLIDSCDDVSHLIRDWSDRNGGLRCRIRRAIDSLINIAILIGTEAKSLVYCHKISNEFSKFNFLEFLQEHSMRNNFEKDQSNTIRWALARSIFRECQPKSQMWHYVGHIIHYSVVLDQTMNF